MTDSRQKKVQFDHFVWIDIGQPDKESLEQIVAEYQLNHFQVNDSLEQGHLPKFEKQPNSCYAKYCFCKIP